MVSVVIPARDRKDTLPLALQSLQKQTLLRWECWVIDDHSTDNTSELLAHYQKKDERFRSVPLRQGQQGANAARNEGLRRSRGEYVLFLDSDDALADFCLERRVEKMAAQPELDFAVWPTLLFDQIPGDSRILWNIVTEEDDLNRYLALDVPWQTAGVLWRRAALEKLGPWNEKLRAWQDWEYHLRALAHDFAYAKFNEPDCYWRRTSPGSIGSLALQHEYVAARLPLLKGIEKLLRSTGKLGERQGRLLAGLYLWHAQLLYVDSRRKFQGLNFWFQAWRRGFVQTHQFLHAWKWLREKEKGSALRLADFFAHWPPEYFVGQSSTIQCLPYQ